MVLKIGSLIIAICFLYSCSSPSNSALIETTNDPLLQGELLYQKFCINCHGVDGTLGASGSADLSASFLDSNEISLILMNGKNAMPPMKELLVTKKEQQLIINYIKTLRK